MRREQFPNRRVRRTRNAARRAWLEAEHDRRWQVNYFDTGDFYGVGYKLWNEGRRP